MLHQDDVAIGQVMRAARERAVRDRCRSPGDGQARQDGVGHLLRVAAIGRQRSFVKESQQALLKGPSHLKQSSAASRRDTAAAG